MGKRKSCYELYVAGRFAARGDIDLIANTLGVAVSTAQRLPYKGHCPRDLRLVKLPTAYDYDGRVLTADEIAREYGVLRGAVYSQAGGKLLGKPLEKHRYEEFSVGCSTVNGWRMEWLASCR